MKSSKTELQFTGNILKTKIHALNLKKKKIIGKHMLWIQLQCSYVAAKERLKFHTSSLKYKPRMYCGNSRITKQS